MFIRDTCHLHVPQVVELLLRDVFERPGEPMVDVALPHGMFSSAPIFFCALLSTCSNSIAADD